jgi:ubiquinone/menaquinone biosynthesis C-methylase UbiE
VTISTRRRSGDRALLTAPRFGFGAVPFVLDVGCGAGGPARTLARRLGTDVVGVDVGGELLRRAHAAARADELWLRCGFVRATVMSLPFADASVPALWSVGALVHAEVAAALTEVARGGAQCTVPARGLGLRRGHDGRRP